MANRHKIQIVSILCLSLVSLCFSKEELTDLERSQLCSERLNEAVRYETDGNYKKAAKYYKKAIFYLPQEELLQRTSYKVKAANCFLLAGCLDDATDLYKELLDDNQLFLPYDKILDSMRKLAECYEEGLGTFLGITDEKAACDIYRMIVLKSPSVHVALLDRLKLAELLKLDDRPEEAANVYIEAIKKAPRNPELRMLLARQLLELSKKGLGDSDGSQLRGAIREANAYLRLAPESDTEGRAEAKEILKQADYGNAARLLIQAKFYLRRQSFSPVASKRYLDEILANYPDSPAASGARDLMPTVNQALASAETEQSAKESK